MLVVWFWYLINVNWMCYFLNGSCYISDWIFKNFKCIDILVKYVKDYIDFFNLF